MDFGKRLTELTGLNITHIIHSVVEAVADRSSYGLEESRHAPMKGDSDTSSRRSFQPPGDAKTFLHTPSSSPSSSTFPPSHQTLYTKHPHQTKQKRSSMMAPLADVDDTAAFMAAARSLKLGNNYGKPPVAAEEDPLNDQFAPRSPGETDDDVANVHAETNTNYHELMDAFEPDIKTELSNEFGSDKEASIVENSSHNEVDLAASGSAHVFDLGACSPATENIQLGEEEDRENLTTFKTWGNPAVRDKPAAKVRRIIMKGLPPSWSTPDKVLSLVHGGVIESISITPSGTSAHILFCDPAACKAFYAKYPNGIDLDKERKYTVIVDMGQDVDVVSSQLLFNLSVGSTRVVRAVGVEMEVTMNELVKISTANNRKVEKVIDSYVPGHPRSVNFRFCSIEDAVRFRAALVRNQDWEQCNVQYATDPCEVASGYHAD